MDISDLKQRLLNSKLFKDSFWAICGNGIGYGLLLLAGIIIARFLGKDAYGEYGVVKSSMFYIATFATLGLGYTGTKFIASAIQTNSKYTKSIVRDSMKITIGFSGFIALLLLLFADNLADFVDSPSLVNAFRALAGVIVFRAITTTQIGILAGFKDFKNVALNSLYSGLFMLAICVPLTYFWSLTGSLVALMSSQIFNCLVNYITVRKNTKKLVDQEDKNNLKELISFSFPIALQESSFSICHWSAIMLLTKYSSAGELGLYSAATQWNAIITMIPGLLSNVVLSYLSSSIHDKENHGALIKRMLGINFVSTFVPFLIIYVLANFISSFYGTTFSDMPLVLRIITLSTIFECCSSVFKSELLAMGKTWTLFSIRFIRDILIVLSVYIVLTATGGEYGAAYFSAIYVVGAAAFMFTLACVYRVISKKQNIK